jgi:hypothetical protein
MFLPISQNCQVASHTSIDKIFVEKLANDLQRIGVNTWFDKWEIKVGDSILWKIEDGIRKNDYLGIVLSPDALQSEWVKNELSSAWSKQMQTRKIVVLPILYRDCEIPLFLSDRKYADFRYDYHDGFKHLAAVSGISETDILSLENWRKFARSRKGSWKEYRELEFQILVTRLVDRAVEYNWSSWVGKSKNPFSITLSAITDDKQLSISIRLDGKSMAYMASDLGVINPNHLKATDFNVYVGNSVNECEEFVWRIMEDFRRLHGDPISLAEHTVWRYVNPESLQNLAMKIAKDYHGISSWYLGDNEINSAT